MSPDNVAQAIQFGSGLLPSGTIETQSKSYNLRVFSEYRTIEQIENTVVTLKGLEPIHVKDVAVVEDGFKESTTEVRADFSEGVLLQIMKQSDANTVLTSRRVQEAIPEIIKRLPQGTKFTNIWDQSEFIMRSITNLRNTALIAFAFAFIVIYFFLRNLRGSIIMGISIPVSIIATFAVLYATDLTLNIISMAGLALAVGMLVDNSIVVLENIYRYREMGYNRKDSADQGAGEVGMAITVSTLTTISVFVPVLFVPNITGQLFKDMVLTITFSLIVSLIVALTLVPLMSANILKLDKNNKGGFLARMKDKVADWLTDLNSSYGRRLIWSINHKKTVLGGVFVLFVMSLGLTAFLGGEFLPKTDQGFINFLMESPSGSPIEETRRYVYEIEDMVRDVIEEEDVQSVSIFFGQREGIGAFGTTSSTIETFIRLTPVEGRKRSQFDIQDSLRARLDQIAGITYFFQEGGSFTTEKDIEIKVTGFNIDGATAIAREIKAKLEKVNGLVDIGLNIKETTPEIQVHLDKNLMNDLNLSTFQVASNISTAIQGKVISQFREKGDEFNIHVQLEKDYRNNKESIGNLYIPLPTGKMIQVKDVATIAEDLSSPTIFRENQGRFVSVGCGLSGIDLSAAVCGNKQNNR